MAIRALLLMKHLSTEMNLKVSELILSSMLHSYHEASATGPTGATFLEDVRTNFMIASISDICTSSPSVAYKKIFQTIKKLAFDLRICVAKSGTDTLVDLHNWKTIKKIVLLASILKSCSQVSINSDSTKSTKSSEKIGHFIYPFVQVCLGIVRLRPPGEFTPFHLHILQCLIDIASATKVFIPISPYLLNSLETPSMLSSGKPSTIKPINFSTIYKAHKDIITTKQYCKSLVGEVFNMLLEYFTIYSTSISFPELIIAPVSYSRGIIKRTSNADVKDNLNIFISKV